MYIEVVAAILFFQNKVLAFQRKASSDPVLSLKYEFPGGKIKKNEKQVDALKRELREELSINVKKLNFFYSNKFKYPKYEVKMYFYKSILMDLNFTLNVHESYKLLSVNDLNTVSWLNADYPVIKLMKKKFIH
tara:strand:+ start:334 stop:732 length:399 start_codon:yes stop_codon:yes gene_type:complete